VYCVLWILTNAGNFSLWMSAPEGNLYNYPGYIQWFYIVEVQILFLLKLSMRAWNGLIWPRAGFSGCLPSTW